MTRVRAAATPLERRLLDMLDVARRATENEHGCPTCRGGGRHSTIHGWHPGMDTVAPPDPVWPDEDHEPGCPIWAVVQDAERTMA